MTPKKKKHRCCRRSTATTGNTSSKAAVVYYYYLNENYITKSSAFVFCFHRNEPRAFLPISHSKTTKIMLDSNSHEQTSNTNNNIFLSKNQENSLQFIESRLTYGQVEKYMPLRYGHPFQIAIPNTSLLANVSDTNTLQWKEFPRIFSVKETTFTLIPLPESNKKMDDIVTYNDLFEISYGDMTFFTDENNFLQLQKKSDKSFTHTYMLTSKMLGYYCSGKNCLQVPIKDIETFGKKGKYKGVTVGRDPKCWGMCEYSIKEKNFTDYTEPNSFISKTKYNLLFILFCVIVIFILYITIIILIIYCR
jgi:hypothetical protein